MPSSNGHVDSSASRLPKEGHVYPADVLTPHPSPSNGHRRHRPRRRGPNPAETTAPARAGTQVGLQSAHLPKEGRFGALALSGAVAKALEEMGYATPTPIQEQAIPPLLQGRDLVGQARTGTGKTCAFGVLMAERLDPERNVTQGIVLAPTRELAMQVTKELERIAKYSGLRCVTLYGGQSINPQLAALERGAHIVVGTPGRVLDHLGRGTLRLNQARIIVLDEADEMLDIGFLPDIERILRHTPRERQTALFSATVPSFVERLIRRYQKDPVRIRVGEEIETAQAVEQVYYEVAERDKKAALIEVLRDQVKDGHTLIFRRMQVNVDDLATYLQRKGLAVLGLHGGMRQNERTRIMEQFRSGELRILVATNVAARGIDVPSITHVINYDMPDTLLEYVHRIGRTGRMDREGAAISFVGEWDMEVFEAVRKRMNGQLRQEKLSLYAA